MSHGILSSPCAVDWMEFVQRCHRVTAQPGCAGPQGKPPYYGPPHKRQAEKPIARVLSPRPPATFGERFWPQEAAQAPRARSGCAAHGHLSGCPPHTRVPSRDSYHVPLGGWTGSSAHSACSPAHPAARPAPGTVALPASRDAGSGPRGHSFLAANSGAGDARRDALRLRFVEEV